MCILVLIYEIRFTGCHTCYSASNGRNSPRFRVRTKELWLSHAWGIKSIFIPITVVLPRNWFKTARPLHVDDSMVIYTLFSSIVGHIWGAVGLRWCKTGSIIGHVGTGPSRGFFRLGATNSIVEYIYTSSNLLISLHWVSHMLFCVQRKKQPLIRGSHKGVMTTSFMGDQI
jgi:hypothetical protein